MSFKIFTLLSLFVSFTGYSQKESVKDSILWNKDYELEWSDFKGAVPFGDLGIKKAASSLETLASCIDFFEDSIPVFKVEAIFIKSKSWTILKNDDLLKHEQGHFDITEIYVRKLRRKYLELNKQKVSSVEKYSQEFEKTQNELDLEHQLYDKEVYFIPENREIWFKKIAKELKELEEYAL